MRAGILIVGSLLWDPKREREAWRRSRLAIDRSVLVRVPIRYGRRSESRGNTFTMTICIGGGLGQAVVVPCRRTLADGTALLTPPVVGKGRIVAVGQEGSCRHRSVLHALRVTLELRG
jgi:hypothetical protein